MIGDAAGAILCTCAQHGDDNCPVGNEVGNHPVGSAMSSGELYTVGSLGHYQILTALNDLTRAAGVEAPRPGWDEYFLGFAHQAATRATCDRKHVGAILVVNRRIISTGYNGSPKGMPHCDDVGHDMKEIDGRMSCVRTLHAESNALDDAGRCSEGGTLYVTVTPCFRCAQRIVQHGLKRVVYGEHYASQMTSLVEDLFLAAGIELVCAGERS